ncbi:MAG: phosphodiester glycosidase family protein [Planctomycetota bacterium]
MTWLDACREAIDGGGLDPSLGDVLLAFGGEEAPGAAALDAPLSLDALPGRIVAVLEGEVDPHQASLFARRFRGLDALLREQATPEAPLLRVMLHRRAAQILDAPPPHALRIRALVDYVWSQAVRLAHRRPDAPSLEDLAAALELRTFAPGLRHGRLAGASRQGPVHVNVLRAREPRLEALDARPHGGDLARLAREQGAPAALSGGFFLYSEPDIELPSRRSDPVGLLISGGRLIGPPVFHRAALIQGADGALSVERRGMSGVALELGGERVEVGRNAEVVHRAEARQVDAQGGRALAIVADRVLACSGGVQDVPLAGFVLRLPPGPAIPPGSTVRYTLPGPPPRAAMAGGPLLLGPGALDLEAEDFRGSAPPLTFSQDETYDQNLLPRMGAGLTSDGELVVVAVDGRNAERAPGLTLRDTARLLRALGCVRALNLDGGSSKRLVIEGRVVDLPSTGVVSGGEPEVRPVHSAILVFPGDG